MAVDDEPEADELDRADRAAALLASLRTEPGPDGYRHPADAPGLRARILEIAALLTSDDDLLEAEDLDAFPALWAWVHRRPSIWETFAPKEPPTGDIHDLVLDGRPDLELELDEDEEPRHPEGSPLASEPIDGWVAIAHGHDGHRFLVWDASRRPGVRALEIDNTAPEVIIREWIGVEALMIDQVLPDIIEGIRVDRSPDSAPLRTASKRPPAPPLTPGEKRSLIGWASIALALVAVVIWLIWG